MYNFLYFYIVNLNFIDESAIQVSIIVNMSQQKLGYVA